jgi:chromate transporter
MQPKAARAAEVEQHSLADFVRYFLGLGTFGFGGPIALAGFMRRDLVDKRRWSPKTITAWGWRSRR